MPTKGKASAKGGKKSAKGTKGQKKAKAPVKVEIPEEKFEPYEGHCVVQGFDEAVLLDTTDKSKKKKKGAKGGKKKGKKEFKAPSELAGSLALNRNGVGVRVTVPKGAVDKTVTLGALCREFDWVVDKQKFTKEVRIVSSVLEISADPPYTLFVQPITVQLSHQCATWERGSLSVVMLQDADTSLYSNVEEDAHEQLEYKVVKGATFDGNVATVKIERMGKLMVVDEDIEGSDLVYAMLEVPDAGQNNLSFKMPVGEAIKGKLMLFPKCSISRPREAYGPFRIAHGTILGSIMMEVEEHELRHTPPMPYLASPFHLSLVMTQPREELQPGPKRIGDPNSALVGEERDVVLHPSNLGIAEKNGIQQKSKPSSEAGHWKWHGGPLSIPFKLRATTTTRPFKSQATCVVTISLRDLDLAPLLVMPQRIHVEIINTYVKVAVRVGMHLDLFIPVTDAEAMSVLDVRRAVNMRLLGWPLSLTKFSPQAGTPFNRWAHEAKILASECKPRVFLWGQPVRQMPPAGAVELVCAEAEEACAQKLAFALEQRGAPTKILLVSPSGERRQTLLAVFPRGPPQPAAIRVSATDHAVQSFNVIALAQDKALKNDEDRADDERRRRICGYEADATLEIPTTLLIPLIGPALQANQACQAMLTAAKKEGKDILPVCCKELLPSGLLAWKPATGGWIEQVCKSASTVHLPVLWDAHTRNMKEFPHDELEHCLDAIAAEVAPRCFPACPVTVIPEPTLAKDGGSELEFNPARGISGIIAPFVAEVIGAAEPLEEPAAEPRALALDVASE